MRNYSNPKRLPPAIRSRDKKYCYFQVRRTGLSDRIVLFVMLNPSKADATCDSTTIRRCTDFAKKMECGWLYVCNLSPFVTPNRRVLKSAEKEPREVWEENIKTIRAAAAAADRVIVAWGNDGVFEDRDQRVLQVLKARNVQIECLALNQSGDPAHPRSNGLNLRAQPQPYRGRPSPSKVRRNPQYKRRMRHRR